MARPSTSKFLLSFSIFWMKLRPSRDFDRLALRERDCDLLRLPLRRPPRFGEPLMRADLADCRWLPTLLDERSVPKSRVPNAVWMPIWPPSFA